MSHKAHLQDITDKNSFESFVISHSWPESDGLISNNLLEQEVKCNRNFWNDKLKKFIAFDQTV